ncbi:MAG: 30S ribosomal protein S6 [Trichlorobacter sp.]|mgnify:CR=1 FL=1|jgi:small subunit ribosomal protein S6
MRKYETIFILQPDLTEEVVQTISSKVEETIAAGNGHYVRLEDWGTRKLAYPINKSPRGRYFYLRFDAAASLVAELERRLRLDEKVLRYLTVNITDVPEKKAAERKPAVEASETAAE